MRNMFTLFGKIKNINENASTFDVEVNNDGIEELIPVFCPKKILQEYTRFISMHKPCIQATLISGKLVVNDEKLSCLCEKISFISL